MNVFRMLLRELREGREVTLATIVDGNEKGGAHFLYDHVGHPLHRGLDLEIPFQPSGWKEIATNEGSLKVMVERITPPPTLVIFGSGHIAECLASLSKMLSFRVVVVDDRTEYLNQNRFPQADQILCGDFEKMVEETPFHDDCYIVIVTRGHRTDAICLEQVVTKHVPYVGMVGSTRKIRFIQKLLTEKGVDLSTQNNLYAPIGLDFHSETPEEIAFSILAEIQMIRSGGTGRPLSSLSSSGKVHPTEGKRERTDIELFTKMAEALEQGKRFALVTIVEAEGHVPRGVGCRSIVWEDGSLYKTIGGGRRESEMIPLALSSLESGRPICQSVDFYGSYDDVQPVCGGKYTYFIQPYDPVGS